MVRPRLQLAAALLALCSAAWPASAGPAPRAPGRRSLRKLHRRPVSTLLAADAARLADGGGPTNAAEAESEDAGSLPSFDLVVVVPSHGRDDAEGRQTIRASWAQYLNKSAANCTPCQNRTTKIVFVVGKEGDKEGLEAEAKANDDMGILQDFAQFGYNAAEKTQRSIRYALEHFKFRLLLKVDMKSWVFLDKLLLHLEKRRLFDINATLPGVYGGHFGQEPSPQNVQASLVQPRYAAGTGYVLSPDLCEYIAGMGAASEDTSGAPTWGEEYGWAPVPRLVSMPREDVSVGFWLQAVNHTKVDLPVSPRGDACAAAGGAAVIDRVALPSQMRARWRGYAETGNACVRTLEPPPATRSAASHVAIGRLSAIVGLLQVVGRALALRA